jgi:hypothetical protein
MDSIRFAFAACAGKIVLSGQSWPVIRAIISVGGQSRKKYTSIDSRCLEAIDMVWKMPYFGRFVGTGPELIVWPDRSLKAAPAGLLRSRVKHWRGSIAMRRSG